MVINEFAKLLEAIETFLDYGNKAHEKLSEHGKEWKQKGLLQEGIPELWGNMLTKTEQRYKALKMLVSQEPLDFKSLDLALNPFRQLQRYVDEFPPYWSAYYEQIDLALTQIDVACETVDKTFHLGNKKKQV